tara:strand:- start:5 stop:1033 length:1029 start_codon:yes stop_codon:yes gene_type:complete
LFSVVFFLKENNYACKSNIQITTVALFLLIISSLFWSSFYNVSSYISVIIAYFAHTLYREQFRKIFIFLLLFNFVLSFYEYFIGKYFFDSYLINELTGESLVLDEIFSGGLSSVFRSKGMFYGPLSLGSFAIAICMLFPKNIYLISTAFAISFFANHRLALIVTLIFLIFLFFKRGRIRNVFPAILIFISFIIILNFLSTDLMVISFSRILNVFDLSSNENIARIMFWNNAIDVLNSYDINSIIFGDNGRYKFIFGNNPESGWLSIILDNGLIGLIFYSLILFNILIKSFNQRQIHFVLNSILIISIMAVFTFHLSGVGSFMFWFIVLEMNSKINPNKLKTL